MAVGSQQCPGWTPLLLLATALAAQTGPMPPVQETWPDGSIKLRYAVDEQGRKHGVCEAFAANGQRIELAHYQHDQLHGAFRAWTEAGKRARVCVYHEGVLHGACEEFFGDGTLQSRGEYRQGLRHGKWTDVDAVADRQRVAEYRAGKLHGAARITINKKVASKQQWQDGGLIELDGMRPFPLPAEQLRQELGAILTAEPKALDPGDASARDRHAALRRLQAYRHLCGLPWAEMTLVPEWNLRCDAAAEVCGRNGGLDHFPPQPAGMDAARYQLGAEGARNSNLHRGLGLPESVDGYMDDSDPSNIDEVGHRRWCLNPLLQRTGFGAWQTFSAMWSMDRSGREPKRLDAVCYPPPGYVPVDLFSPRRAFSIALKPGQRAPNSDLLVALRALDADYVATGEALALDHCAVAAEGFGRGPCVIFRSPQMQVAVGQRYQVEVSLDGGKSLAHRYVVEFCAAVLAK